MQDEFGTGHVGGLLHLEFAPEIDGIGTTRERHGRLVPHLVVLVRVGVVLRTVAVRRNELHLSSGEDPVGQIAGNRGAVNLAAVACVTSYTVAVIFLQRSATPRVNALQLTVAVRERMPVFGNSIALVSTVPLLEISVRNLRLCR